MKDKRALWEASIRQFLTYAMLERNLAVHSVQAYENDLRQLMDYVLHLSPPLSFQEISTEHISAFLAHLNQQHISARSQARRLSCVRHFYKYLIMTEAVRSNPTDLIEAPKLRRSLPQTLSVEEIGRLLQALDRSDFEGRRNYTLISVMYACGLRVSEAVHLRISDIFFKDAFIRVLGKGGKERLIPVSDQAIQSLTCYLQERRTFIVQKVYEDMVFITRKGCVLNRVSVFLMVRKLAQQAGIAKRISPHTFRHSFATHLLEGGADIRAIQAMLGHESITTTEIYTHMQTSFLRSVLSKYHPYFHHS